MDAWGRLSLSPPALATVKGAGGLLRPVTKRRNRLLSSDVNWVKTVQRCFADSDDSFKSSPYLPTKKNVPTFVVTGPIKCSKRLAHQTYHRGQNLSRQRHIKAALQKLPCKNDIAAQKYPSPPFTLPSPCCRLFFGKYILRRNIHAQSNTDRGKGWGKVRKKKVRMSPKCTLDSVVSTVLPAIVGRNLSPWQRTPHPIKPPLPISTPG